VAGLPQGQEARMHGDIGSKEACRISGFSSTRTLGCLGHRPEGEADRIDVDKSTPNGALCLLHGDVAKYGELCLIYGVLGTYLRYAEQAA
jgi:hypothetical protein